MKFKNRILMLLLLVVLIFGLISCAKCISTEYENVEVTVIDSYHRGIWRQPVRSGKTTTYITYPEVWQITVEYNGVEYTVSGNDTYNKYKDKIGQIITGKLEIRTYDNGTIKHDIISLE